LFGNLAPSSQGNGSGASQTITNAQPEKKDEPTQAPTSTLFGNSASSLFTNAATQNQTEEKKAPSSGLFGGLASNQTSAPSSSETKASSGTSSLFMPSQANTQAPTQTESKKEEPKPSLFGGLTSGSSGLFGPNTSSPQKNPAPTSNSSINASPAAGLFTNAAKQSEQTAPQQTSNVVGGGSSFLNQSPSENKSPAAGSIFANFKSAVEKKPETGTSSGTGLFNNNSNVGDNKSTSESLFGKPTSDKPSGGAGGTLFNNNQSNLTNTTDNAPKSGGLFGNLASAGGGSGLFGNVQSKPGGSGLFGNNANTGSSVTSSLFGNK